MISLFPKINISSAGNPVTLNGDVLTIHEFYAVHPFDGSDPIWFTRNNGYPQWVRTKDSPPTWDSNTMIHTMDPITAVILKLVTPEQVKMPDGVAGLLALLKA